MVNGEMISSPDSKRMAFVPQHFEAVTIRRV
jgi:hypothetical protein